MTDASGRARPVRERRTPNARSVSAPGAVPGGGPGVGVGFGAGLGGAQKEKTEVVLSAMTQEFGKVCA